MTPAEQYAPSFAIQVNGKDLRNVGADVLSLTLTDTSDRADSFNFTVRDRHPDPGRFAAGAKLKWMDNPLFDEGAKVKIQMGYVNNLGLEFWGLITASAPSFPESGLPTLAVQGYSLYWMLEHERRGRPFESATDSGIAKESAAALKLKAQVDPTAAQHPLVLPNNATYSQLLKDRAQRIGYELVVKKDTLYFEKPRYLVQSSPALTLEWGKDLRSFSPRLSLYEMVTEVEVRSPQSSLGKGNTPLVGTAKAGEERCKMGAKTGSQIAQAAKIEKRVESPYHDAKDQQEAKEIALAQLETQSLQFISGSGSCIGNPKLTARSVIALKGLGQRFSGSYYVISATHVIDASGYRTTFDVRRNGR